MSMALNPLMFMTKNQMPNMNTGKAQSSNSSNAFQQVIGEVLGQSSQSEVDEGLIKQISEELTQLLSSLKQGDLEGLPDDFLQSILSDLSQLTEELNVDRQQALMEVMQSINFDDLELQGQQEGLQLFGTYLLNGLTEQPSNNQQPLSNLQMLNSNHHQGKQMLAKILQTLMKEQTSKTTTTNTALDQFKLSSEDQRLPKEWVQKWNSLLTKLGEGSVNKGNGQQLNSNFVNAIKQMVFNTNQPLQEFRVTLPKQTDQQPNRLNMNMTGNHSDLNHQNQQMSRQEQLVVHMTRPNQSTSQTSNQQQMIEQLQKIIQSTRFAQSGGTKQLSIQLKPANLGEMQMKFLQMDGQMTVKITVASQAAKEMLEGNLQQLRHMFSPNQVSIERQVEQPDSDYTQQFMDDDSGDEQTSEQDGQSDQSDQQDQPDKSFKDYLFEEEV
ncbi:flagellar hook-length control protein FliK [Aquisalibacillus elongatus]|uniref:Flagellar hook-length control protein FliK n=1 Tax=Aquisalibacillus elongatus TaxID=485577 RepID=A0A3N5C8V4_9BACI|nr:flagellar hook-length control protein FliK [Aquisalibacillus elongatus]RPF55992.1 flagellar hook-length control protein FliK [Aquisalibacillus elongatus]